MIPLCDFHEVLANAIPPDVIDHAVLALPICFGPSVRVLVT